MQRLCLFDLLKAEVGHGLHLLSRCGNAPCLHRRPIFCLGASSTDWEVALHGPPTEVMRLTIPGARLRGEHPRPRADCALFLYWEPARGQGTPITQSKV